MAVSSQDILNFLLANPNMSDSAIAAAMDMYGVTPAMMAEAVGIPVQQVQQRYEQVQPQGLFTAPIKTPEPVNTPQPVYSEPAYVAPEPVAQTVTQPVITPEPQTTQEATTMAVTSKQIVDFLLANPNMSDAQIVSAMETYGISPSQMATAVGLPEGQIAARVAATVAPGQTVTLGDTIVQPVYQTTGSGQDQQVGGIENVITYKTGENKVGGGYTQYTPSGEVERTGTQQEVNANKDFLKFAVGAGALLGLPSLLNAGAATGATGAGLEFAGSGGAFDLANAGIAGGTSSFTAAELAAIQAAQTAGTTAAATTGGLLTNTAANTAANTALTNTAATTAANTVANTAASTLPAVTAATTAATALTPTATTIASSLIPAAVKSLFTPTNIGNLVTSGAQTAAGLLQQQTSKEAADKARAMIEAETAAAKQSAAFRPIGMTTRFGTSQFAVDPVTGQLTSAGYTLSPEAKNAQDRLVKLAESGLQQAEGAQQAFAPLQTGAQSLFGLGNKYLAQNPQDVAQNYLNQQMALLQPGRELELANLQNRLQQQGRGGLAVAQGGALGATTPELQALFNARATQEAQLAANAQQYGQQNVAFGAGLLGTGAQTMGNYYAGQQQAYAPYTTALGQVQGLETLGQQPLTMGASLGQQAATAGARVGTLGLEGANISQRLATGANATTNPYAQALMAAGNPNAMFGQSLGNVFGGLFS